MYNILICDDEKDIVSALKIYFSGGDYKIFEAYNGEDALRIVSSEDIHLVLLDVMMPIMDGITALNRIRQISNVPVIMLTAKSEDSDKVLGLDIGADDYVTKPFNPVELTARVRSQLRRYITLGGGNIRSTQIIIGGLCLDDEAKSVSLDGDKVMLTPKEYDICRFFMMNPGKVFSPKEIYKKIWGEEPYGAENTLAVHIRHIREKIEIDPSDPRYITVVWGKGYMMEEKKK